MTCTHYVLNISPQCFLLNSSSLRTVSMFFLFNVSLTICPVYNDAQQKYWFGLISVRIVLSLVPYIGLPENRVWGRELHAESLLGSYLWRYTCQEVRRQDWAEEVVIPPWNFNWGPSTYHKGRGWDIHQSYLKGRQSVELLCPNDRRPLEGDMTLKGNTEPGQGSFLQPWGNL